MVETCEKALRGIKVLVTRPEQQAVKLCKLIQDHGGKAIRFPVFEIKPNENQQVIKNILRDIAQYDIGIFVSKSAVDSIIKLLGDGQFGLGKLKVVAMGSATAVALEHISSNIIINDGPNSESLLEMDALDAGVVRGKKIIIFRGNGGRELLAEVLKERDAKVTYADVYRRECPQYDEDTIGKIWTSNIPDVIVVTSNNGLQNLFSLLNSGQRALLLNKQLIVMGKRMIDFAKGFGFAKSPIHAEGSSDEGILNSIVKWVRVEYPGEIAE